MNRSIGLLSLCLLLIGCGPSMESQVVGNWRFSKELTPEETARVGGEEMAGAPGMVMVVRGKQAYNQDATYDAEVRISLIMSGPEGELDLSFVSKQTGTWKLMGDVIVETNTETSVTPGNAFTRRLMEENPGIGEEMIDSGDRTGVKIVDVNKYTMTLLDEEHDLELVLYREG